MNFKLVIVYLKKNCRFDFMMKKLNFPEYIFKTSVIQEKLNIFDFVRKKYVLLTEEEWVRQHILHYLIHEKEYPITMIIVEKSMRLNRTEKRADILIYNKNSQPAVLIECKAPTVKISQKVFEQIARYNMVYKVKYLMVTNGLQHFCCELDYENSTWIFLNDIPAYSEL